MIFTLAMHDGDAHRVERAVLKFNGKQFFINFYEENDISGNFSLSRDVTARVLADATGSKTFLIPNTGKMP
jgi:hypothetical protein